MKATLWFNVAHYALQPLAVDRGRASRRLIVYPTLDSIQTAFPSGRSIDRAATTWPIRRCSSSCRPGLLGLVVASLAAAYMSTISTHLNWGASYVVDDVYRRFVKPRTADEKRRM